MKTITLNSEGISVYETIIEESDYASIDIVNARLNICSSCEYIIDNEKCSKCSCLIQHRTKYIDIHCPENKW